MTTIIIWVCIAGFVACLGWLAIFSVIGSARLEAQTEEDERE
jgi:hypothetical protein